MLLTSVLESKVANGCWCYNVNMCIELIGFEVQEIESNKYRGRFNDIDERFGETSEM
jgi:hypothetical protein